MAKSVIKKVYERGDVVLSTSVASRTNFNILKGNFVVASLRVVFKELASERFFLVKRPGCYCEFTSELCSEETLINSIEILREFLNDNGFEYRGTMTRVFPNTKSYYAKNGLKVIQFKLPKQIRGKFFLHNDRDKIRIVSYKQFKQLSQFLNGKIDIIALDDFIFKPSKNDVAFVSFSNITQNVNNQYYSSNNRSSLHISHKESMKNITVHSTQGNAYVSIRHIEESLIENEQKILFPKVEYPLRMENDDFEVDYSFDKSVKLHKLKFNLQLKDYEGNQRIIVKLPKTRSSGIDYPYEIARNVNRKGVYISFYVVESFIRNKFKLSSRTEFYIDAIEGKEFYKFVNDVKKKHTLEFMKKKYVFLNNVETRDELEAKRLGVSVDNLKEEKLRLAEISRKKHEQSRIFYEKKEEFSSFIINIILGDYHFAKTIYQNTPVLFNEIMREVNARESTIRLVQRKKGGNCIKGEVYAKIRASIHRYVTLEKPDWIKEDAHELMNEIYKSGGHVSVLKEFRKIYKERH